MKMIDEKNAHIGHLEVQHIDLKSQLDDHKKRSQDQSTKIQTIESELFTTK